MLKLAVAFLCSFLVVAQAGAVEITVKKNTKKLGDGKNYILEFDSSTDVTADMVDKMLKCYEAYGSVNRDNLVLLFGENHAQMKNDLETMRTTPAPNNVGTITIDREDQYKDFIHEAFKDCLTN